MKFVNKNNQYHYVRLLVLVWFATQLLSCAFAPWEPAVDKTKISEAQVSVAQKNLAKEPEAVVKRKDLLVTTELAATNFLVEAEQAQSKGNYEEAINLYNKVLTFLPDSTTALNGKIKIERELAQAKKLESVNELIQSNKLEEAKEPLHQVLLENPQNTEAIRLQNVLKDKLPPQTSRPPQLKTQVDKPITLELRDANIKVVFEALSRATGINFILDKDIKPDTKASIFIKKARIEDAIDMVLSSNGLQKKVLSENTVLVFSNTQQKLKDYQDLMIRSFYFSNTSAKQVAALLKSMLKTKDIFVDDRLNMLVMRDTPEVIRIAEKLVAANDLEDPEVMLDIEVLEVSRGRLQELGIVYPNQLAVIGTGLSGSLTLDAIKNISSETISVSPNPAVNFRKTSGDVNLLSNPRIRVKNNEKAKILVGDKVPIITTTSTANVGISESVQYIDVGLKLDVEPRITLNNFVNIKIGLEVSSLGDKTRTSNGAEVYTIGTRNANTVLSLKNGETQVLAGLISDDERKNASKLPGLGDIPLLGRLFSNQLDQKTKTEIVLAITPRIISNIDRPNAEISEYWSGTETLISDKPQINLPAVSTPPMNAMERAREQMRLRQQQAQELQAEQPEPVSEPISEQIPTEQAPERPAGQSLETVPVPAAIDSANPPPGL
jgi:general secretion pathway protein D